MMNLRRIKIHRKCCRLLSEAGLNQEVVTRCSEQRILKGVKRILKDGISAQIRGLEPGVQEQLLNHLELQEYIFALLQQGAAVHRCNSLLEQVGADILMGYEIHGVLETLLDVTIPDKFLAVYLKYYRNARLSEAEKRRLVSGLENYFSYRKDTGDILLMKHSRLLFSELVSTGFLLEVKDYDRCLMRLAEDKEIFRILLEIYEMSGGNLRIDEDTFQQIEANPRRIGENLRWAEHFFSEEEREPFISLLVGNRSLLYDLGMLKRKVISGKEMEAHQMIKNRIAYVSFFYDNPYIDQWRGDYMEELIIYAISHKKKAFLLLIQNNKEVFMSLPYTSVLFRADFYSHIVNINTMNERNLKQCSKIVNCHKNFLELFYDKQCTFEEFAVLSKEPWEYAKVYFLLQIPRVDERLNVIREVIHKSCLRYGMDFKPIAEQLSVHPLSYWMQKTLAGIDGLDAEVTIRILENYKKIGHLTKDVRNVVEARYIVCNIQKCQQYKDMESIREEILRENKEWLGLQEKFCFSPEFIQENEERIRNFIFDDGAYIMWTYLEQMQQKAEELRRLVYAELAGRFREVKYFGNDLEKELDYPVSDFEENVWMENLWEEQNELRVWEEDGLLPVMRIGEVPYHTCLSYKNGMYKDCLLACHDSNKKILYLSLKGKIVLRAAIRLTKGFPGRECQDKETPQLEFADLSNIRKENSQPQKEEQLVLFLEKAYMAGLPENMQKSAMELIFRLMERKAKLLNVFLVASGFYISWKPDWMHFTLFSIYISKSKAGSQYLDSLDGSQSVTDEGSYQTHNFLMG